MDISKFTIEDFIYDSSFRKWVLQPDVDSQKYWDGILSENPLQSGNVMKAKGILLRMQSEECDMSELEFEEIWANINAETDNATSQKTESKIIPLYSYVNPGARKTKMHEYRQGSQFLRIAAILIVSFGIGTLAATFYNVPNMIEEAQPIVYEEHNTQRGVKSFLTLSDGSNVTLNSGSSIKYVKGFEKDKREIVLDGEAYFDVFKDVDRPFIVKKKEIKIIALGTAFNVEAYGSEALNVSLVSGKVAVGLHDGEQPQVLLEKGESLQIESLSGTWSKAKFNEDEVLAWTKKIIVFNETPVLEAVRVLENWYSIDFHLENHPSPELLISGRFENETLENVLKGLSYTTELQFTLKNNAVNIKF